MRQDRALSRPRRRNGAESSRRARASAPPAHGAFDAMAAMGRRVALLGIRTVEGASMADTVIQQ